MNEVATEICLFENTLYRSAFSDAHFSPINRVEQILNNNFVFSSLALYIHIFLRKCPVGYRFRLHTPYSLNICPTTTNPPIAGAKNIPKTMLKKTTTPIKINNR